MGDEAGNVGATVSRVQPYKGDYLVHDDDRVLTLEGGLLGWVDLWRGIRLCSVLDADPVVRYIRFPTPLEGNKWMHIDNEPHQNARPVRDVTFSDGFIKLVEMEYCHSMHASAARPCTHEGWTIVTWNRKLSSDSWKQDCSAYVSTSSILPLLRHDHSFFADVCWIPESEVLVEGLDPCVTVNQLKGIAAMFGELCYLRIDADEQCGLVKYVSRFVHS
ncbi:hypothetical protein HU200_044358 [Digitaria exilis]|uniref:DUF1618 domain-containing protein n=1 Tax=Digitaria exilis TaxID=1010633 RepID=A0A835B7L6_9POAL|nr:hypothetical protein HU200_044358 [Digitaria exilis]